MIRKIDQIRVAWAAGDQIRELRIAARFFDRSDDTKTFKRGMDPDRLAAAALELLAKKFSL